MIDFVFLCFCVGVVLVSGCLSFFIGGIVWEFFRFSMRTGFMVGICYFGFRLGYAGHAMDNSSLAWLLICVSGMLCSFGSSSRGWQ